MLADEITITSADAFYTRTAWLVEGPSSSHTLGVLLDGELYRDEVHALPILSALTQQGRIPPMSWVLVSHGGADARHSDYVGDPRFARFVADDVVGRVRERVPRLSAEGHLVGGLSLSGLAAAHIALLHRTRFTAALCQSGSFWWEPDAFAHVAQQHPPVGTRFWLSVGDEETETGVSHPPTGLFQGISQIDGVERARAVLERGGGDVHLHGYRGGHAFDHWRAELGDALCWLLRTEQTSVAGTATPGEPGQLRSDRASD